MPGGMSAEEVMDRLGVGRSGADERLKQYGYRVPGKRSLRIDDEDLEQLIKDEKLCRRQDFREDSTGEADASGASPTPSPSADDRQVAPTRRRRSGGTRGAHDLR